MSEDEPDRPERDDDRPAEGEEPPDAAEPTDRTETVDAVDAEEADLPLSELRKRMEARGEADVDRPLSAAATGETDGTDESELFEEVNVGDIDGEAVWDAVVEGEADAAELLGEEPGVGDEDEPAVEPGEMADEHVVAKREYCQRCEYFSEPPNATCTNEGTEIVELVDSDHFRVRDCPKVAVDDEALSGFASDGE